MKHSLISPTHFYGRGQKLYFVNKRSTPVEKKNFDFAAYLIKKAEEMKNEHDREDRRRRYNEMLKKYGILRA